MSSRLPLTFILITVVIDAMGIGLIMPVMPDLIREVTGGDLAQAAVWGGILSTVFAVMQFLFGPVIGNLSDRFGRRPVLLISLLVMSLDYIVMAVAGTVWLLLIGRIVGGITAANHATAAAYIADISTAREKARRFGLLGAAFGVGFVLGPLLGGILSQFGTRAPFYAAAGLAASNMLFGFLVLPETVTDRIRRPLSWRRANPLGAFAYVARLPAVGRLLMLFFLYEVAFFVYPAIWAYFTQLRFGWDARMIGLSLAAFGVSMAVVQGALVQPIISRLGDRGTVFWGLLFNGVAFLSLGLVQSGWLALLLTPLTALGSVVTPALQSMASRAVPDDSQGELQGVVASIMALGMATSPLLMTQIFALFTGAFAPIHLPGAPFLLSMALMAACAAIFALPSRRFVARE